MTERYSAKPHEPSYTMLERHEGYELREYAACLAAGLISDSALALPVRKSKARAPPFKVLSIPLPWTGALGVFFVAWRGASARGTPPVAVDRAGSGRVTASFAITDPGVDDGRRATFAVASVKPRPALEGTLFGVGALHSRQGIAWAKEALLGALKREGVLPKVVDADETRVLIYNDPLVPAAAQRSEVWLRMRTRASDGTSRREGVVGDAAPRYAVLGASEARTAEAQSGAICETASSGAESWLDAFRHRPAVASPDAAAHDGNYELRVFVPEGAAGDTVAAVAAAAAAEEGEEDDDNRSAKSNARSMEAATEEAEAMQWAAGPLYPAPWLSRWSVLAVWPRFGTARGIVQALDRSSNGAVSVDFVAPQRIGGAASAAALASALWPALPEVWACVETSFVCATDASIGAARDRLVEALRRDGFEACADVVRCTRHPRDTNGWRQRAHVWVRLVACKS